MHKVRSKIIYPLAMAILMVLSAVPTPSAFASDTDIWSEQVLAAKYFDNREYEKAFNTWLKIVSIHEAATGQSSPFLKILSIREQLTPMNYAIYLEKIGNYYAGIYGDFSTDSELAVEYYDKSHYAYIEAKQSVYAVKVKDKANDLRVDIRLFYEKKAANSSISNALYVPKYGAYIGMYAEPDLRLTSGGYVDTDLFSSTFGRDLGILLCYSTFGVSKFPTIQAELLEGKNMGFQIAMEPMLGLDSVVDNEYIRTWAKDAKASGLPIYLRFACEMNGDWVPWYGDPEKYKQKFRLIHDIMAEEAPNVMMLWSPNDIPFSTMLSYYPGDKYVDWIGVSSYATPDGNNRVSLSNMNVNPIEKLEFIYQAFVGRKPIMIAEGAPSYYNSYFPDVDFNDWYGNNLEKVYHYLPRIFPGIKGITYFNASPGINKYELEDNKAASELYSQMIASPYYISKLNSSSPIYYEEIKDQLLKKEAIKLSTYAYIYDPFIGKVEYYLDRKLIATSTAMPFELNYDFTNYKAPIAKLRIKVYDSNNQLASEKTFNLSFYSTYESIVTMKINDPYLYKNNEKIKIEQNANTTPIIIDSRTYIPARALIENLGGTIAWEEKSKTVTLKYNNSTLVLTADSKTALLDGELINIKTPLTIRNGRTYLPVRFFADTMGVALVWDSKQQKLTLSY
ncbi:MAG: hypothetical protein CVU84_03495 [Firmicutes bacterium HGW-Firmicutes-1]|jgi:hypothetical protein|nr:MAG: hypothetical protein CVU84_03495 [Firmicutes bacterium HGW-Firmicutes-1]